MSESNEISNKKYYNYSVLSEDQKALSKNTSTETNSNKIGFTKQQVNVGDLSEQNRRENQANKNRFNHQSNIFGDEHLKSRGAVTQKREGYNLITGESYGTEPVKRPSQQKPSNEGPVQTMYKSTRPSLAPVYTKTW